MASLLGEDGLVSAVPSTEGSNVEVLVDMISCGVTWD